MDKFMEERLLRELLSADSRTAEAFDEAVIPLLNGGKLENAALNWLLNNMNMDKPLFEGLLVSYAEFIKRVETEKKYSDALKRDIEEYQKKIADLNKELETTNDLAADVNATKESLENACTIMLYPTKFSAVTDADRLLAKSFLSKAAHQEYDPELVSYFLNFDFFPNPEEG